MCQAQNEVTVNIWSSLPQDCIHSQNILFFPKSARWWRRPWVGEPRELCIGGSAGRLFLLAPSLPLRRPLPHLEGNCSIKRARWTAAELSAAPFRPRLQERVSEVKKYRNSRTTRGAGGVREGGALEEGRRSTPSEPQMFSSWPWGAAPQPRAFRRLCVRVSEEGITQREQPRQRGVGAAGAVERRLAFFVDF